MYENVTTTSNKIVAAHQSQWGRCIWLANSSNWGATSSQPSGACVHKWQIIAGQCNRILWGQLGEETRKRKRFGNDLYVCFVMVFSVSPNSFAAFLVLRVRILGMVYGVRLSQRNPHSYPGNAVTHDEDSCGNQNNWHLCRAVLKKLLATSTLDFNKFKTKLFIYLSFPCKVKRYIDRRRCNVTNVS